MVAHHYVRVRQKPIPDHEGQLAWSSPVWILPK